MKKFLASVLGAAMVVSSFALFAGCGGAKIYIDGNFKEEASAEQVETLKSTVRGFSSNYAGDTSADDWKYGIRMITDGKNNMQMSLSLGEKSMNMTANMDADIDMNFSMAKTAEKLDYGYGGKFNIGFEFAEMTQSAQYSASMKGNIYGNKTELYFDGSVKASLGEENGMDLSGKYKFTTDETIYDSINEALSTVFSGVSLDMDSPAENAENFIDEMFAYSGAKVYIDDSDAEETKVKISVDKTAYLESSFSGNGVITEDVVAEIVGAMDFKTADYYLSFNKTTGVITGYGGVFDVSLKNVSIDLGAEGSSVMSFNMSMDVDYSAWVLLSDDAVVAPEDIADYVAA